MSSDFVSYRREPSGFQDKEMEQRREDAAYDANPYPNTGRHALHGWHKETPLIGKTRTTKRYTHLDHIKW